jgi:U2 small nuclear ribonucleoprotein B''
VEFIFYIYVENNLRRHTNTIMGSDAMPPDSKIKPQPTYPPNSTLYLSNIDWSIKKALLKRSLLALFSRHGKVIEVICLRGEGGRGKPLRGQAWIIYESLSSATAAIEAERGFIFFGRPLIINYAKEVSDRVAKRDGTYSAKVKRVKRKPEPGDENDAANKTTKLDELMPPATAPTIDSNAPSAILVAKDLPAECNDMMLAMLFRQYSGYKAVSLVGGGVAKIEFGTESEATAALNGLHGFKLTTSATLELKYGN